MSGPIVTEVRQVFSDWASHVLRFYQGAPSVEVEWTAGPIPINTPWLPGGNGTSWGKEVVLQYVSWMLPCSGVSTHIPTRRRPGQQPGH